MTLSKRAHWIVAIVYWLAIFTLTHLPAKDIPPLPVSDKVEHMTAYGVLGILLFAAIRAGGTKRLRAAGIVIVIGLLYGAADELLQIPVGRSCDIRDWYADSAGIVVAVLICCGVEWRSARKR